MPWYEVKVEAVQVILVEADDADRAAEDAWNESFGSLDCDKTAGPAKLIEGDAEIERSQRHADVVLEARS